MARKSGWQEFTENFNGVYGAFTKAAQGIETARVMNDEKFTAEGKGGAGLEGSSLEAARYRALSDIQAKYGDVKGALESRNSYQSLRNSTRENEIGDATQDEVTFQRGLGASNEVRARTNASNASAASSYASARNSDSIVGERNALLPGRLTNQSLTNTGLGLGNDNQVIQNASDARQAQLDQDAYNYDLRLREIAVDQALANVDATESGAVLNDAQTDQITTLLPGRVATQLADLNLTEVQTNRIERLLDGEEALQGQQLLSAISAMGLNEAQTKAVLERLPGQLDYQAAQTAAVVADTTGQNFRNDADQTAADLRAQEASFVTQVSDPEYWKSVGVEGDPTPQQRRDALVGLYQNSNIPVERQIAVVDALDKHGIDQLQNVALETAQGAKNALQSGGLPELVNWYDGVDDGDATSLSVVQVDGGFQLVKTSGSGESAAQEVLYSGANQTEIEAQLMGQITNPGAGMEIAASILDMRATAATTENTEARTFTEQFTANAVQARTALVEAQTTQVLQEIEAAKGGLTESRKIAEQGLAALLRSDEYLYMGTGENGLAQQAAAVAQYRRAMGMEPAPPTQEELDAMTPQQRALFE
jgi:hypothetical protein